MKTLTQISFTPLLLMCAIAAGCGGNEEKAAPTQVAAKVNDTEITVYQVNNVLSKTQNVTPEVEQQVKREILDTLIDQQLARQQAIEMKLDRSPKVLQTLEAARTEILARAFVEQIAVTESKPNPDEIKKYYDGHPGLFAQRRLYSMEEISMPAQPGLAATLRDQAAKGRSLQDITGWLRTRQIRFTENRGVRAAEQLPLEHVEEMSSARDGETRVFELRGGIQVIRIVASKRAPVDEASARPRIQQFLLSQRTNEAVSREMKQVKTAAKIEYMGEFTISAAEAEEKARTLREAAAKTEAEKKAQAEAESIATSQAKEKAALEARERTDSIAKARAEADQARRAADAQTPRAPQAPLSSGTLDKGLRGL